MDRRPSILDSIGHEIIGVMSPVSICMLLVVLLVSTTTNSDVNNIISDSPITAATLVYQEAPSDSALHKLEGALLNAAAFVALVTAATFLLFLLYYFNFTSFLKNYMRFSAFFVLFSMGGSILFSLLRRFSLPLDAGSSLLLLFNFAAVGVLSVFSPALPILLRQGYMVALGIIVAASFTRLPEWTTWTLLLALAVYDLVAVLAPGGPLRLLVNLASSRDEELPAFVYEARPTTIPGRQQRPTTVGALELMPMVSSRDEDEEEDSPLLLNSGQDSGNASAMGVRNRHPNPHSEGISSSSSSEISIEVESSHVEGTETETAPLVAGRVPSSNPGTNSNRSSGAEMFEASGLEMPETTRGIRLGLGDFVFYSVLVGRAAMYDWMTVYACYLAIIAGLGCTLILLAVWRQALPALPISITLGVMFYFLTRLLMEPFVVGASTSLVMF